MSYTEERDEIARLFGYSKEDPAGEEEDPAAVPPAAQNPPPPPARPPEPEPPADEDEEILVYEDSESPDLGSQEFYSFDQGEKPHPHPAHAPLPPQESHPPTLPPTPEEIAPEPRPANNPPPVQYEQPAVPRNPVPLESPPIPVPEPPTHQEAAEISRPSDHVFVAEEAQERLDDSHFLMYTHGLVKIYGGRTVVNGVDIRVRPGEIVGLLGPNGAGKTTSFYMIVGLVPPNGGKVFFNGHNVTELPMYQRARLGMGYLPQEESIFRKLSVEQNIMAVMETLDIPKSEKKARCEALLERFSITHIRKNIALTCSGGEKRRLTIARSLVSNPSLLMLDEPFSGVDPIAVNEIQSIVQDLRDSGLAILITDHNARQTLELVDRAYLIYEGKVLREGSREFLINDPVSRELYLGDRFSM